MNRTTAILATLFCGAFIMGCAEMLVIGMIDLIAIDLAVTVPAAGALVTANALGLAIGGPVLTFVTGRFDRRHVLLGATGAFVLGNLLPALGADYPAFLVARVLIGAVQGLFIAAAIATATSIVPPAKAGRAISVVISGFATASALGLPLGTLLGQAVGWRASFALVVAVAAAVLLAAWMLLPSVPTVTDAGSLGQLRAALAPRVLALLALCALLFTAMLSAVTYLVPFFTGVAGAPAAWVGAVLLGYGVATTAGSAIGGRFADHDAARTLVVGSIGVTVSLLVLYLLGSSAVVATLAVLGIGVFGMGMAPSLQHRVASLAGPGAALAASLPASAVNLGIAAGSLLGGMAIIGSGVAAVPLVGAAVAVLAIAVAWATARLQLPAGQPAHPIPAGKEA